MSSLTTYLEPFSDDDRRLLLEKLQTVIDNTGLDEQVQEHVIRIRKKCLSLPENPGLTPKEKVILLESLAAAAEANKEHSNLHETIINLREKLILLV